jgi:hypothetical protein
MREMERMRERIRLISSSLPDGLRFFHCHHNAAIVALRGRVPAPIDLAEHVLGGASGCSLSSTTGRRPDLSLSCYSSLRFAISTNPRVPGPARSQSGSRVLLIFVSGIELVHVRGKPRGPEHAWAGLSLASAVQPVITAPCRHRRPTASKSSIVVCGVPTLVSRHRLVWLDRLLL